METATYRKNKFGMKSLLPIFLFVMLSISLVQGAVLSIDQASVKSNYFGFDKAWIVSMVSDDYTTDFLNAYLTPQDFEDASGSSTKQALKIDVDTKPNYCTYSFKTNTFSYQDVYTIEPIQISKWLWTESDLEELKDMVAENCADFSKPNYKAVVTDVGSGAWTAGDYVYGDTSWLFKANVYCVKLNEKIGTVAQPIDKRIVAESDWSVQAEGKSAETKTVSNSEAGDGRSTKIGNNVWIQWQGNLGTGEDCPDVSNLIGVHDNSFYNGWIFASRDKYNTYRSYLTNGIKQDIREYSESSYPDAYRDLFRERANVIMRGVTTQDQSFSYSVLDTSVNNGKVRIDLGRNIVFPLFRLIIDADYLELVIPTGVPSIESVSNVEFTEGLTGQLNTVVKNVGEGKGGFTVRVKDCTQGFSSSTSPIGVTLEPGASKSLSFNIIGSTTSEDLEINGVCTLEMKESTTQEIDTQIFSVKLKQIQQCTPLSTACGIDEQNRDVIKQCNSAGTKYEVIEVCTGEQECRLTTGGAKCVDIDSDDGAVDYCEDCDAYVKSQLLGSLFKSQRCEPTLIALPPQTNTTCFLSYIKLSLIPLILIMGTLYGSKFFRTNRNFKIKDKNIAFLVALTIAGILAWLVFSLFVLGVIVSILYLVGLGVVKRYL